MIPLRLVLLGLAGWGLLSGTFNCHRKVRMIVADHRMQEHVASETIQCDNSMINRASL